MISLIIADDDPIIITGLSMIIKANADFNLLGTASDGEGAVELCRKCSADVAMLDIRMSGKIDGIEAARLIAGENLSAPLILTTFDETELIARALQSGAMGYILKNSPPERILAAIRTVANGGSVFSPDILQSFIVKSESSDGGFFKELTARELEIVKLIAEGLSNTEIAARLFVADGTVRNYVSAILEKTGLSHRTGIAVKWWSGKKM